MVDRKIFYATDTEIWSVVVDMTNPQHQRIVTSQYTITGELISVTSVRKT